MFAALWGGQCCCLLPFLFRCFGACFEAVAVVAGLQNMASMGEAIEQRGGHFGVRCLAMVCMQTRRGAKYAGPFAEAQVGGDALPDRLLRSKRREGSRWCAHKVC